MSAAEITALESEIALAKIRTTTHGHTTEIEVVAVGEESVQSTVDAIRPEKLGLPKAYARRGFAVACSTHTWRVSAEILTDEVQELNANSVAGIVYLSTKKRVKQGRGTALVLETLVDRKWKRV